MTHALGGERPRLVVVESLALSTPLDPYLTLKAAATYASCSIRWLRARLTDPAHPLPHYRVAGKLLIRRGELDAWLGHYRRVGAAQDLEAVVTDVLARAGSS